MPVEFTPLSACGFFEALLGEAGFILLLALASAVLPGRLRGGFKLNGLLLLVLVLAGALLGDRAGAWRLATIPREFPALLLAANGLALAASLALAARGPRGGRFWSRFFYGTNRNPVWLGIDWKRFSYRPSLIGLGLINVSLASLQLELHGRVAPRMILYQAFYLLYVANYFQFEYGMLFTWDVMEEKFGWMLVWGDYVLVPFFYCIPGLYLVDRMEPISAAAAAALAVLYAGGFWLFRGANQQKHDFKENPQARIWGAPARALGGRLLVSGFWGIGRKLNYTGELALYWSWTLLCGFHSFVPYLLPLWLTGFLPHRAWRDEKRCRAKYGELWQSYCARARFRMIPFVY